MKNQSEAVGECRSEYALTAAAMDTDLFHWLRVQAEDAQVSRGGLR